MSQPIKGTATRATGDVDSPVLRASAKDAAENIMIVDLMRNDLSQICRPGTVTVEKLLELQAHPGLWHLVSTVSGQLADGVTTSRLLAATFPPGSVTGAPKYSAWVGSATWNRTLAAATPGRWGSAARWPVPTSMSSSARWSAASTRSSSASAAASPPTASPPANGTSAWPRRRRWCRPSVRTWIPICDLRSPRSVTGNGPAGCWKRCWRSVHPCSGWQPTSPGSTARVVNCMAKGLRMILPRRSPPPLPAASTLPYAEWSGDRPTDVAGLSFDVGVAALGLRPNTSSLALAARSDLCWRHKWANRRQLERAEQEQRAGLPYFPHPAGGQVAETSRGNLFCQRSDGVWMTPPLDHSLLPGVTRREVLDLFLRAAIPFSIEFFSAQTLRHSAAAFWTSSLSGAVPVTAVDGFQLPEPRALIAMLNAEMGIG